MWEKATRKGMKRALLNKRLVFFGEERWASFYNLQVFWVIMENKRIKVKRNRNDLS